MEVIKVVIVFRPVELHPSRIMNCFRSSNSQLTLLDRMDVDRDDDDGDADYDDMVMIMMCCLVGLL